MKKIIQKAFNVPEIAEYYSDFNHDKRAYASLKFEGWYGSNFDLEEYEFHLDDDAVREVLDFILSKLDNRGSMDLQDFRIDSFERF